MSLGISVVAQRSEGELDLGVDTGSISFQLYYKRKASTSLSFFIW